MCIFSSSHFTTEMSQRNRLNRTSRTPRNKNHTHPNMSDNECKQSNTRHFCTIIQKRNKNVWCNLSIHPCCTKSVRYLLFLPLTLLFSSAFSYILIFEKCQSNELDGERASERKTRRKKCVICFVANVCAVTILSDVLTEYKRERPDAMLSFSLLFASSKNVRSRSFPCDE